MKWLLWYIYKILGWRISDIYINESCNNNLLCHIYKIIDSLWIRIIKSFDNILINYWYNEDSDMNMINKIDK